MKTTSITVLAVLALALSACSSDPDPNKNLSELSAADKTTVCNKVKNALSADDYKRLACAMGAQAVAVSNPSACSSTYTTCMGATATTSEPSGTVTTDPCAAPAWDACTTLKVSEINTCVADFQAAAAKFANVCSEQVVLLPPTCLTAAGKCSSLQTIVTGGSTPSTPPADTGVPSTTGGDAGDSATTGG